jgi:hypothetical protein
VTASTYVCSPLRKEQTLDTQFLSHGPTSLPGRRRGVNVFARAVRENAAVVKLLRRGALLGLLAGIGYAAWKTLAPRTPAPGGVTFEPAPFPSPPRPVPAARASVPTPTPGAASTALPWVEPSAGECPISHPVKAKMASGIFHVPGGGSYERTNPDRCYVDAASAESDGLRAAKN